MLIKTLCEHCQKTLAAELADADTESSPLRMLDAYCPHHGVAINVVLAAGLVAHWTVYPVRDESDFRRITTATQKMAPGVLALAAQAAKPAH